MGIRDADCFFRDKTLLAGQGHGRLAHEHDILTLVLSGRLDERFASGTQSCGRWELHYKPRGAVHVTSTGPAGVRMFILGVRGEPSNGLTFPAGPRVLGGGASLARALGVFLSLTESGPAARPIDGNAVKGLRECLEPLIAEATHERPAWVTEAYDFIMRGERVRVEQMAREFRVHAVYLARVFRKHYGRSVSSLRRRVRVDRAVDRLAAGARSLADVAHDLGYADQSHFTREFKRETGWSPGRFRAVAASLGRRPPG